jgi:transposase
MQAACKKSFIQLQCAPCTLILHKLASSPIGGRTWGRAVARRGQALALRQGEVTDVTSHIFNGEPAPIIWTRIWGKTVSEKEVGNAKREGSGSVAPRSPQGALSATEGEPGAAAEVKRWSAARKKEVVLRLLRGEPVDAVFREVAVPIYKLDQWRDRALAGIDSDLKERENDPVAKQVGDAKRRIGELIMEVEILHKERQARRPLVGWRSSQ